MDTGHEVPKNNKSGMMPPESFDGAGMAFFPTP